MTIVHQVTLILFDTCQAIALAHPQKSAKMLTVYLDSALESVQQNLKISLFISGQATIKIFAIYVTFNSVGNGHRDKQRKSILKL